MAKKLFMSLENEEATQAEETVTVAENDAEAAVATVNEVVADIKEDVETLEDAVDDIGELEAQTEVVEGTLEDGGEGMTEDHAKSMEITVESLFKRLGVDTKKSKKLVSTEAFGSTHTRKQATQVTLEGFKETLVSLWERVKEVAKQIWDKVVKFFNDYFTELGRLKNGITALEKQVKDAKGSPKEQTLKLPEVNKAFWDFNAKEAKPEVILTNHITVTKAGLQFADGISSVAESILSVFKKDGGEFGSNELNAATKKNGELLSNLLGDKEQTGPYFNGSRFKITITDADVGFNVEYVPFSSEKGIPALDKPACEKILNQAKQLLDLTEKFKEKQSKIKAFQASIIKSADVVITAVNKMTDESEGKKDGLTKARALVLRTNTTYTRILSTIPGLNTNVIKAAMNYVQASLRNMGEAAAAPADASEKKEDKTE